MLPQTGATSLLYTAGEWGFILIAFLAGLGLKAIILWWLHRDTTARGRRPLPWILFAVLLDIPTIIVWSIVRPPLPGERHRDRDAGPATDAPGETRPQTPPAPEPYPAIAAPPVSPARAAAPEGSMQPATGTRRVRVTCPRCGHAFTIERALEGPTQIACPSCGLTGKL